MFKTFYPTAAIFLGIIFGFLTALITMRSLIDPSLKIGLPLSVHAATSAGNDGFSIATGQIDENVEGLFFT